MLGRNPQFNLTEVASGEPQLYVPRFFGAHGFLAQPAGEARDGRAARLGVISVGAAALMAIFIAGSGAQRAPDTEAKMTNAPSAQSDARARSPIQHLLDSPEIRSFVGLAENAWDFTQPDTIPGFGPLAPPQGSDPPAPPLIALGLSASAAPPPPGVANEPSQQSLLAAEVPEIVREFLFGAADTAEAGATPSLLEAIAQWLAANFELPAIRDQPRLTHASPETFATLRYGPLLKSGGDQAVETAQQRTTVAVYIDAERTIYLPQGWAGRTPAELSVLVHEMVHHLQNLGRVTHECPSAREKLAYAAQQRWLNLFGRDLEGEFELNPFTVLVKSTCGY
jgi:hypothetical protein